MSLTAGSRLGGYEILGLIGAGGMGEVYRAADTKLGRDVAIKVLPEAFARDPERLARFQREARVLASLNHPNIAAIYGLEESGDLHYLVLEFVPGETLAGPLPAEEALAIARQITAAMDAANEKGVVHRDLKPANIKITPEGKVKVLDFGLAKALSDDAAQRDASKSPTVSIAATRVGVILGTAAYMSPEQARGRPLDRRTDIWSFGCVVYELLAGRQAFGAETVSDTLSAVLSREPDWARLPANTPPGVERLLRRCLQKDPAQRLRDIGDAWIDTEAAAPGQAGGKAGMPVSLVLVAGALVAALAVAGWTLWRLTSTRLPVTRAVVTLPATDRLTTTTATALALSLDGSQLVYAARRGGRTQLYLRRMDQIEAAPMPGTEDAAEPFFSPDGEWVGFFAGGSSRRCWSRAARPSPCAMPRVAAAQPGAPMTPLSSRPTSAKAWVSGESRPTAAHRSN